MAGKHTLVVRAGKEGTSVVLEVWSQRSLLRELHVPSKVHGSVFNDGWFSTGASWDPQEQRIAYVAEARATPNIYNAVLKMCTICTCFRINIG